MSTFARNADINSINCAQCAMQIAPSSASIVRVNPPGAFYPHAIAPVMAKQSRALQGQVAMDAAMLRVLPAGINL